MKEFNNLEEMEKYFNKETNTYNFIEDGIRLDIKINFNIDINARNINARNINARNIDARNIDALNINARNIDARNISFYAVCTSYNNIYCTKCEGRREHAVINTLDGDIYYKESLK